MNILNAITREAKFMVRDRAVLVWMMVVFILSSLAVWSGIDSVEHQSASIERLQEADREDRMLQLSQVKSWGSAAYYGFYLTHDEPSDFAFASMGQRDLLPWKHRVRMLALEGQIYERDTGNPLLALVGRLDFAFVAVFVLPFVLIMLLYDLRAGERVSGRHDLLVAVAGRDASFWLIRAFIRALSIFFCLVIPLFIAGLIAETSLTTLLLASLFVFVYTIFWTLLCYWFAAWRLSASVILVALAGVWITLAVIVPAAGRMSIDRMVPIPSGADILMTQREAVNDAWDLPKATTMNAFWERYPEWNEYKLKEGSFDWSWYYAFQQVGDQKTEPLTMAYREGRLERDRLAGIFSLLAPPILLERSLQALAKTDFSAAITYEDRVRDFHKELRDFYYQKMFREEAFDNKLLKYLPVFAAGK
jgi:ABC-2 type transport system permease protein